MTLLTVVLLLAVAYTTVVPAVRAVRTRPEPQVFGLEDRAGALAAVATAVTGTIAARQLLPWDVIPPVLWALPATAAVVTAISAVAAWPVLPGLARPAARRATSTGLELVVDAALVVVLLLV